MGASYVPARYGDWVFDIGNLNRRASLATKSPTSTSSNSVSKSTRSFEVPSSRTINVWGMSSSVPETRFKSTIRCADHELFQFMNPLIQTGRTSTTGRASTIKSSGPTDMANPIERKTNTVVRGVARRYLINATPLLLESDSHVSNNDKRDRYCCVVRWRSGSLLAMPTYMGD